MSSLLLMIKVLLLFCLFVGGSTLRCYFCSTKQKNCPVEGDPKSSYQFNCLAFASNYCVKIVSQDGSNAVRLCSKEPLNGCNLNHSIYTQKTEGCAFSCKTDLCNGSPGEKQSMPYILIFALVSFTRLIIHKYFVEY